MSMISFWTPTDPFREIDRFFDRVSRETDQGSSRVVQSSRQTIRLDAYETPKNWIIQAELPGFKKDNIHVNVEGNRLTISGENKQENDTKDSKHHIYERHYGKVQRMITLPKSADVEKVEAKFEDGILKLEFEKKEVSQRKEIKL